MPTLDFKYNGTGFNVVWANSYFYRHTQDVEDSSYGTQQILTGPVYLVSWTACPAVPVGRRALPRPGLERGAPLL